MSVNGKPATRHRADEGRSGRWHQRARGHLPEGERPAAHRTRRGRDGERPDSIWRAV